MIFCKSCVSEEMACCDFCQHYDFNGSDGFYSGEGYCDLYAEDKDPDDVCGSFHCEKEIE